LLELPKLGLMLGVKDIGRQIMAYLSRSNFRGDLYWWGNLLSRIKPVYAVILAVYSVACLE